MNPGLLLIQRYFPEITTKQARQFEALETLYKSWNDKINVISRKDIDALYERHILHSLAIAKIIRFQNNTRILDVGTGGGFPGIPLAILMPHVSFHLVDSIGKKIKVVNAVSEAISLENVMGEHIRAEDLTDQYDFVISRAVARLKPFVDWVAKKIDNRSINTLKNGILYLKGGDIKEELSEVKWPAKIFEIHDFYESEFFETKKIIYLQAP